MMPDARSRIGALKKGCRLKLAISSSHLATGCSVQTAVSSPQTEIELRARRVCATRCFGRRAESLVDVIAELRDHEANAFARTAS